jgi:hypothetical protein
MANNKNIFIVIVILIGVYLVSETDIDFGVQGLVRPNEVCPYPQTTAAQCAALPQHFNCDVASAEGELFIRCGCAEGYIVVNDVCVKDTKCVENTVQCTGNGNLALCIDGTFISYGKCSEQAIGLYNDVCLTGIGTNTNTVCQETDAVECSIDSECNLGQQCVSNKCIEAVETCTDSDGGKDSSVKGTTMILLNGFPTTRQFTDVCIDSTSQYEYYCREDGAIIESKATCTGEGSCTDGVLICGDQEEAPAISGEPTEIDSGTTTVSKTTTEKVNVPGETDTFTMILYGALGLILFIVAMKALGKEK